MKNICVVNVNWLGDAIFSTPVFKALRAAYPKAKIACLCVPRVAEVLIHCPDIDDIIVYDEKGRDFSLLAKIKLILKLKQYRFDSAFMLHRSMSRALLIFLSGIPLRIGFSKARWLLTHPVDDNAEGVHRSDYYLRVLSGYGISITDRRCCLDLKTDFEKKNYWVFHIGGNWSLKRWPVSSWTELARRLAAKGQGIIFTGGQADKVDIERVITAAGISAQNLAGQTSLKETLVIFAGAKAVVSADSGPLHLANSVGTPVLGIFGATRPEITGPRGMGPATVLFKEIGCNHAPCYHLACKNNQCMQAIGVEDVWQAIQKYNA